MSFERYINSIIDDFIKDMKLCNTLPEGGLSKEQIQEIHERFEKHKDCYEHKDEFDESYDVDLFTSVIYGNNQSAAIECNNCNEIIIDDEVLNLI